MKRIVLTPHLTFRLRVREIPKDFPEFVYQTAEERYFDRATGRFVAVSETNYKGQVREFAVVYEETAEVVRLITIHPLKKDQKHHRIHTNRWQLL